MPTRSILLRVLFASLAAAAFFGAVGILFSDHTGLWRIAGTSIATAAAALLLLPAGMFLDKPLARRGALAGVAVIVAEYLLALAAIWAPDTWDRQWRLWGTFWMVAVCAIPAIALVRMLGARWTRLAGFTGLAILLAVFVLVEMQIWADWATRRSMGFEPAELGALLVPYGLLIVLCLIGEGSDRHYWRWLGVVAAGVTYAIVAYANIKDLHGDGRIVVYITALAAVVAHANLMLIIQLPPRQAWLRWLTILFAVASGAFISMTTFVKGSDWNRGDDLLIERIAGACGVLAGCGTLAAFVLTWINRKHRHAAATPLTELRDITVVCPLCRKKQVIPLNTTARCGGCNVQIVVKVEEPRCHVCGYSLMMLTSGVCPECGTRVTPSPAPASTASADATGQTFPPPPVQTAHTS